MRSLLTWFVLGAATTAATSPDDPATLWSQLESCHEPIVEATKESRVATAMSCMSAAENLLATESLDESRLWSYLEQLPADGWLRGTLLARAFERRVREALSHVPEPEHVPPETKGALEQQLQQAEDSYKSVREAVAARIQALRARSEQTTYLGNSQDFERTLLATLRGELPVKAAEADLARFVWGSFCGMGSEQLYEPQRALALLSALEDGRWLVAAGALEGTRTWDGASRSNDDARRRLLGLAGLDWELYAVGAALAGDGAAYRTLGEHGDERAARLLLAARDRTPSPTSSTEQGPDEEPEMTEQPTAALHALAAFVTKGEGCPDDGTTSSEDVERTAPASLSDATEQGVLAMLAESAGRGAGAGEAEAASRILLKLCRPESRAAFEEMLASPFADVRRRGASGLRSFGVEVDEPAPSRRVRLALSVDGRAFAGRKLEWEVEYPRGLQSSSATTDDGGTLALARDLFVDPKAPPRGIALESHLDDPQKDVWFRVEVAAPRNLDTVVPLSVDTQRLTLRWSGAKAETSDQAIELLSFGGRSGRDAPDFVLLDYALSRSAPLVLRAQRGRRYQVTFYADGELWMSDEIELGEAPAEILVGGPSLTSGTRRTAAPESGR